MSNRSRVTLCLLVCTLGACSLAHEGEVPIRMQVRWVEDNSLVGDAQLEFVELAERLDDPTRAFDAKPGYQTADTVACCNVQGHWDSPIRPTCPRVRNTLRHPPILVRPRSSERCRGSARNRGGNGGEARALPTAPSFDGGGDVFSVRAWEVFTYYPNANDEVCPGE